MFLLTYVFVSSSPPFVYTIFNVLITNDRNIYFDNIFIMFQKIKFQEKKFKKKEISYTVNTTFSTVGLGMNGPRMLKSLLKLLAGIILFRNYLTQSGV